MGPFEVILTLITLVRSGFNKWNASSLKFNLAKKANMTTVIRC